MDRNLWHQDQRTIHTLVGMQQPAIHRWIKTECGRAKYAELAARPGLTAQLRLGWFVLIAALRDWSLPLPDDDTTAP